MCIYFDTLWAAEMLVAFGDLSHVTGSKHDLLALAKNAASSQVKPRRYQCCGTEEFLHVNDVHFGDAIRELPFDPTYYEEGPGEYVRPYWDKMIQTALKWMLLQ